MHNDYGQRSLLANFASLTSESFLEKSNLVWLHGWKPASHNSDVDMIIGESAETSLLDGVTYFVGRLDQEEALRDAGLTDVHSIGLPFGYALKNQRSFVERRSKSIAIMPANHGDLKLDPATLEFEKNYISSLLDDAQIVPGESNVILNCDDIRRGRGKLWEEFGFSVLEGACSQSRNSLIRLARLLNSFETMTTNGFGSHVAYAAAAGCKVSLFGQRPPIRLQDLYQYEFFKRRPELAPIMIELEQNFVPDTVFTDQGFLVPPKSAVTAIDWGKKEIGFDNIPSPETLRDLIMSLGEAAPRKSIIRDAKESLQRRGGELWAVVSGRSFRGGDAVRGISCGVRNILGFAHGKRMFQVLGPQGSATSIRWNSTDYTSYLSLFRDRELDEFDLGNVETILDLGAYAGFSINYFLDRFPEASILALEPDLENYELLRKNIPPGTKVTAIRAAAWSEERKISIIPGPDGHSSHKTVVALSGFDTVPGLTLTKLITNHGWPKVDLIKMSLGGPEYAILARQAIEMSEVCETLLVDFSHRLARRSELQDVIEKLEKHGGEIVMTSNKWSMFKFLDPA